MKEYVKCRNCNGSGEESKPPWVAGDQNTWFGSTTGVYKCRTCGGSGVIVIKSSDSLYG